MTQAKIDINHAEAPELIRALTEQPCPCPADGVTPIHDMTVCGPAAHSTLCPCYPSGLANPWASLPCSGGLGCLDCVARPVPLVHDALIYTRRRVCNGSGRVPKAVGVEELFGQAPSLGDFCNILAALRSEHVRAINEGGPPDYLLAALRAIAKAQGL